MMMMPSATPIPMLILMIVHLTLMMMMTVMATMIWTIFCLNCLITQTSNCCNRMNSDDLLLHCTLSQYRPLAFILFLFASSMGSVVLSFCSSKTFQQPMSTSEFLCG